MKDIINFTLYNEFCISSKHVTSKNFYFSQYKRDQNRFRNFRGIIRYRENTFKVFQLRIPKA